MATMSIYNNEGNKVKVFIPEKKKPVVVFWSTTQQKSFEFANQKQFENFQWENFVKGENVYDDNGCTIGIVKMITESKVWITDEKK